MTDTAETGTLTERDAAFAYARAWNRLNCRDFIKLLAEDAHYASQYVLSELESRQDIEKYLTDKMHVVKATRSKIRAEFAMTVNPRESPCVLLYQDDPKEHIAVVLFQVKEGRIKRYDLCVPILYQVEKSGIFPV